MPDGYIDIKIQKSQTDDINKPTPDADIKRDDPGKLSIQDQAVNTALINAGKQMATQAITQYANLTGDYATANVIDTAVGFGADLATLAIGPVGWIAVGTKYTTQIINQQVSVYNTNRETEFIRDRMGLVSARGSRYGD